jgi:hypothetical protein
MQMEFDRIRFAQLGNIRVGAELEYAQAEKV